jgi:hypothetical protein
MAKQLQELEGRTLLKRRRGNRSKKLGMARMREPFRSEAPLAI